MAVTTLHGCDESGTTAQRPTNADVGFKFFNTTTNTLEVYNGTDWLAAGSVGSAAATPAIAGARVLTAADSGGVFTVAKTSAYAITLPTPAQGLRFKFMVLDTGAFAVTISNGSAHLKGLVSIANAATAMTGTTITLTAAGSIGDWVSFEGINSTTYLVTGACIAAADISVA